jgi:hypothetical protein
VGTCPRYNSTMGKVGRYKPDVGVLPMYNDHSTCGNCCQMKKLNEDERKEFVSKYSNKQEYNKEYNQLLDIYNTYFSVEKLNVIHHQLNTTICESLNFLITKTAAKNNFLSMSLAAFGQTHISVSIHSLGYEHYYEELFEKLV